MEKPEAQSAGIGDELRQALAAWDAQIGPMLGATGVPVAVGLIWRATKDLTDKLVGTIEGFDSEVQGDHDEFSDAIVAVVMTAMRLADAVEARISVKQRAKVAVELDHFAAVALSTLPIIARFIPAMTEAFPQPDDQVEPQPPGNGTAEVPAGE